MVYNEGVPLEILIIYPEFPDTFWSFKHALTLIHKNAAHPPQGLLTVGAMLPKEWPKRLVDVGCPIQSRVAWAGIFRG